MTHDVLDTIAAPGLRETLRVRLRDFDHDLVPANPGNPAREFCERSRTLPPLVTVGHASAKPSSP